LIGRYRSDGKKVLATRKSYPSDVTDEEGSFVVPYLTLMTEDSPQGYTGEKPAKAAREKGIELSVVKLPEAKKDFVLLPRQWVVERSLAWLGRFRQKVIPETACSLGRLASNSRKFDRTKPSLRVVGNH
jgi:transposase